MANVPRALTISPQTMTTAPPDGRMMLSFEEHTTVSPNRSGDSQRRDAHRGRHGSPVNPSRRQTRVSLSAVSSGRQARD